MEHPELIENFQNAASFTPTFKGAKKKQVQLRRLFVNLLLAEDYAQLSQKLSEYPLEVIQSFFLEEGHTLLNQAILANNAEPLKFIVKNIPLVVIQTVFNEDKSNFLEDLFYIYSQKLNTPDANLHSNIQQVMWDKLFLLLTIDAESIQAFMEHPLSQNKLASSPIQAIYQSALTAFEEQKTSSLPKTAHL